MDPSTHSPPLVCVNGMLRVAQLSDLAINNYSQTTTQTNVTPFKQLASPFNASAPFTAPTTPYSPAPTTTPTILTTPYSTTTTHFAPTNSFSSFLSPTSTPNPPTTPARNTITYDLQPQPQTQLLTQKQVRELRRLCRKTANRAEFEDRLIQVRQVASIAAMAASTIHLFDPGNPTSGQHLRAWVDKHRAQGSDWRDERPLSNHAIAELRRWDLLLKAWARVRFDNQSAPDSRHPRQSRNVRADNPDAMLKPVRLEFEKISMGALPSPTTPASIQKPRNVYSTDFLRLGSPVTPADGTANHLADPAVASSAAMHTHTIGINPSLSAAASTATNFAVNIASTSAASVPIGSAGFEDGQPQSAWGKPPLTGLTRWVDSRRPMSEVSINRVGDTIKVTVPPSSQAGVYRPGLDNKSRLVALNDQENAIPAELRRGGPTSVHASTTAKSWRNALMQTPESHAERGEVLHTAAKTLFAGYDGSGIGIGIGSGSESGPPRSPMDWGKFRRGETSLSGACDVWQHGRENI